MRKSSFSLILWTLGLSSMAATACSAADPGVGYLGTSHQSGSSGSEDAGSGSSASQTPVQTPTPTPTSTPTPTPKPTVDAGSSGVDAGGASDAGGSDGAAVAGFLGETTAYASKPVAVSAKTNHANNGAPAQTPGMDCLGCHNPTGTSPAPFLAAGFVATAANGTTGASDVEVRVLASGANQGFSVHTDDDGFFWVNPPVGGATGPYSAGVRNATVTKVMPATPAAADCMSASCHGGSQGPIHI